MTAPPATGAADAPPNLAARLDGAAPLGYASRDTGRAAVLPAGALPHGGTPPPARLLIFVALFAATLLLPTLGGWRVLTRHEVLACEPAREMLHGGRWLNWIIPQFGGEPRAVKPPTMGWLVAGSMALFHSEAEWVARLPSGLAAVLMAVLVADLASRWLGTRVGLIAGLMQATFVYVLMQGRLAEADMPMAAAVCLAMYAFARGCVQTDVSPDAVTLPAPRRPRWLPLLFYLGTGLSFLLKGVGPVFIVAGCGAYVTLNLIQGRDRRPVVRFLLNPLGLLLLGVLLLSWPLAARTADPGIVRVWHQETVGRFGGEMGERKPWYFYCGVLPVLLMPWLPFAMGGVFEGVKRRAYRGPAGQFLLCWFVPGMLILSASAWKHHHYTIPMLPAATLPAAAGMALWLRQIRNGAATQTRARAALQARLGALLWGGVCAAVALGVWRFARTGAAQLALTVGVLAAGGAATAFMAGKGRPRAVMDGVFATAWAVAVAVGLLVIPRFEEYRDSADFARRAAAVVPPGAPTYLVSESDDHAEYHAAYYLHLPVLRIDGKEEVSRWLASAPPGDLFAVCTASLLPRLRASVGVAGVAKLDQVQHLRRFETEADRQVFVRISRSIQAQD